MSLKGVLKWGAGGGFFLLPLFFLLQPYAQTFEHQMSTSKLLFCFGLGNLAFAIYLGKKIHPFFFLAHFTFSVGTLFTGFGSIQLYPFTYWMAALCAAIVFLELEEETQRFLFKAVVLAAVASSILSFLQALDADPILKYAPNITDSDRVFPVGLMGQATKNGAFLAIAMGMALGLKDYLSAAVISAAAILTCSSFTFLALGGAAVVFLRPYLGKALLGVTCFAGAMSVSIAYIINPFWTPFLDNGRFIAWKAAILAWWDKAFWLGFGPGSFAAIYPKYFQPAALNYGEFHQSHNDYVDALFSFGALGGFALLMGSIFLGTYYWHHWWINEEEKPPTILAAECGLAAILLNALGNFPFQLAPHYLLAVIFLALLLQRKAQWGVAQ